MYRHTEQVQEAIRQTRPFVDTQPKHTFWVFSFDAH